jgi:hypothetical protein
MSDELELKVTEYKVYVTLDGDEVVENPETQVENDQYTINLKSIHDLSEQAKIVAAFNQRQIEYCKKDQHRDFILKRIINNNQL